MHPCLLAQCSQHLHSYGCSDSLQAIIGGNSKRPLAHRRFGLINRAVVRGDSSAPCVLCRNLKLRTPVLRTKHIYIQVPDKPYNPSDPPMFFNKNEKDHITQFLQLCFEIPKCCPKVDALSQLVAAFDDVFGVCKVCWRPVTHLPSISVISASSDNGSHGKEVVCLKRVLVKGRARGRDL